MGLPLTGFPFRTKAWAQRRNAGPSSFGGKAVGAGPASPPRPGVWARRPPGGGDLAVYPGGGRAGPAQGSLHSATVAGERVKLVVQNRRSPRLGRVAAAAPARADSRRSLRPRSARLGDDPRARPARRADDARRAECRARRGRRRRQDALVGAQGLPAGSGARSHHARRSAGSPPRPADPRDGAVDAARRAGGREGGRSPRARCQRGQRRGAPDGGSRASRGRRQRDAHRRHASPVCAAGPGRGDAARRPGGDRARNRHAAARRRARARRGGRGSRGRAEGAEGEPAAEAAAGGDGEPGTTEG